MSTTSKLKRGPGRPRRFDRDQSREIRRLVKTGIRKPKDLAIEHNTTPTTIYKVVKGEGAYSNTL